MSYRRIKKVKDLSESQILYELKEAEQIRPNSRQPFHFSQQRYSIQQNNDTRNTIAMTPRIGSRQKHSKEEPYQSTPKNKNKDKILVKQRISLAKPTLRAEKFTIDFTKDFQQYKSRQRSFGDYQQLNRPHPDNFTKLLAIGKGGFGRAWKVIQMQSRRVFAMKIMRKTKIIEKQAIFSVMNERKLLEQLRHAFIVNMRYAFQDSECLYLIMDYCERGDLRYHLVQMGRFQENHTRFFLACIVLCLEYLHSIQIIHRDLKPENLVLDERGYVRVTDFGISRPLTAHNGRDTSGTPGYMAPEVILRRNHSYSVDFYALGVIAYEFMTGKRPYLGSNRQEVRQKIISKQVQLRSVPEGWSNESVDFINRLIQRIPEDRLGFNGIDQIKDHAFFKTINWQLLHQKKLLSPFIPKTIQEDYLSYRRGIPQATQVQDIKVNQTTLHQAVYAFRGYEYDGNWAARQNMSFRQSTNSKKRKSLNK